MHKKLASELDSLAHEILKMRNKDDIFALRNKTAILYEKISVLAYIEHYINTSPQANKTKEELLTSFESAEINRLKESEENNLQKETISSTEKTIILEEEPATKETTKETIEKVILLEDETPVEVVETYTEPETTVEEVLENEPFLQEETSETTTEIDINLENSEDSEGTEEPILKTETVSKNSLADMEPILFDILEEDQTDKIELKDTKKVISLEEELNDTLPVDMMVDLFTKAENKITLNDRLSSTIEIGLNDRIAFVNHLFDGNQHEFNGVLSQLNIVNSEKEAKDFINKKVKPNHDWSKKEEYEARFMELIERKFI